MQFLGYSKSRTDPSVYIHLATKFIDPQNIRSPKLYLLILLNPQQLIYLRKEKSNGSEKEEES